MTDDLAEVLGDIDVRLAKQRRADAIRDAARCKTADEAADISRRFAIAQTIEDDDAPVGRVLQ
jgi:hypothetical protein